MALAPTITCFGEKVFAEMLQIGDFHGDTFRIAALLIHAYEDAEFKRFDFVLYSKEIQLIRSRGAARYCESQ